MDVQTDTTDPPPPGESQSRGKIRKGFKLFGKRKPGNIFSLRSKKDDNGTSSSPNAIRGNGADGLPPDSEQEREKENGREASRGEREEAEDEPPGEDGEPAANAASNAAARASVSSAGSAKSLGFLSLLRGGRRGTEDRRVRAASRPAGRQRRGLKGLFGSVKFRSKDKEEGEGGGGGEEEEAPPPSPLLMSSRANSVEIIKDDLPLTPKARPRSLDSLQAESRAPDESDEGDERPPPLPTSGPPLEPGENSLSCLLADISSLLTFDSITGGGDVMADVEAEWGKASSPVRGGGGGDLAAPPTSYVSKPFISTPTTSFSVGAATKPSRDSRPLADSTPPSGVTIKSTAGATKPSTAPSTSTDLPAPVRSLPPLSSTSPATAAPPNTPAPPVSSTLARAARKPSSPPPALTSVSRTVFVAAPTPGPARPPPAPRPGPAPVALTQPPSAKMDSPNYLNLRPSASGEPSWSFAAGDSDPPATASPPSSCAPVPPSKAPATPSGSGPAALSKPTLASSPMDSYEAPPPPAPDKYPSSSQPRSASVPTPSSFSFDRIPPVTKLIPAPASLDETAPVPPPAPPPTTRAAVMTACPTPPAHIPVSRSEAPPAPAHITSSVSKDPPAQTQVSQSKAPPVTPQIPIYESNDLPAPVKMQVPQSKAPPAPAQIPISVSKDPFAQMQVSQTKAPPVTPQIPISVSKDPFAQMLVPQSQAPPPPAQIPVCISTGLPARVPLPVSASQDPPHPITLSQSKAPPPSPSPSPVASPLSPPWWSEAPASAKTRQASVDERPIGPSGACFPPGGRAAPSEESRATSLQGQSRERRLPQAKASGLSKIPVVGGGRAAKPPARDGHHGDDEACRAPPTTPVLEEEEEEERAPRFPSHDSGSKDKVCDVEASKRSREESQQLPKGLSGVPRDSKIPVKNAPQAASHIPLPCRTKIPVSKVPVRRAGNKPAAAGAQMRK